LFVCCCFCCYSFINYTEPKAVADQTSAGSSTAVAKAPTSAAAGASSKPKKTAVDRRAEFAIRPGYSSGASSYDGSVGGDDDLDGEQDMRVSRHTNILALSDLRQEMVAEGDLTKTVVRIEVCGEEVMYDDNDWP